MKVREIKEGDILRNDDGSISYTVVETTMYGYGAHATVEFADGGRGPRYWDNLDLEIPLERP